MKPGPAISQQLGPLGINMGKVISEVNSKTKNFVGMQVPVILDVDPKTKNFNVEVLSPPVSALLKKEAQIDLASGDRKKYQCGNLAIEQIIFVAKQKYPDMLVKDFKKAVLCVLGSAMSMGLLIENKDPKEVIKEVKEGKYDELISQQKTEASKEKLEKLREFFSTIKAQQDAMKKAEEEAKAAEEQKKAQQATAKPKEEAAPSQSKSSSQQKK